MALGDVWQDIWQDIWGDIWGASAGTSGGRAPLNTGSFWRAVAGTETVTYFSRTAESVFATGVSVGYCKRQQTGKTETDGIGLRRRELVWHLWAAQLGGIVCKANDKLTALADGTTWDVTKVDVQRFGQRFRLTTLSEV